MAFNPNEHMMSLKGKDYLQVAWRLVWFREEHPDYCINTDALTIAEDHAIFKATITDANGVQISAGHGSESKRDFGDFIEKAETKAVGRALAMLGYGTQFAADELDEGERIVDGPVDRKPSKAEPEKPIPMRKPSEVPEKTIAVDFNEKPTPDQLADLWELIPDDGSREKVQAKYGKGFENMTLRDYNACVARCHELREAKA